MDETDYLRGLEKDPDNREMRAAYQNWLESRADPRAAWLRLMDERARLENESHEISQRILQIDWQIASHLPAGDYDWLDVVYPLGIRSPMVGRVYLMPAPDAAPFVSVGDVVRPESTVCKIEALKIFNDLPAGIHGVISAVLVANGEFIEFNQLLFKLKRFPHPLPVVSWSEPRADAFDDSRAHSKSFILQSEAELPMPTKQQIDSFLEFASAQMDNGGAELSMDELYCLWRVKQPTPAELAQSVAAVRAAFAEMEAGDTGRPARMALRKTCQRLGLVIDE